MTERFLRGLPLFAAIPDGDLAALAATLPHISFPAGTLMMHEGDHGDQFFILLSGHVAIVKALGTPDERVLGSRDPGDFIGEMSLLNQDGLRTASAQVLADTEAILLERADFDRLLRRYPLLAYDMLRVVSERLRDTHNIAIDDLRAKNAELARAYADQRSQNAELVRAYAELAAAQAQLVEKEALERELRMAREIQESMLPRTLPRLAGADLGARMVPAREVAGDFFDAFAVGENAVGLVIGDVCGKGMPAAMFMAQTRSLLRAEAARSGSAEEALRSVNRHLMDMNAAGLFVTVVYGILLPATREFTYARAGHDLPMIVDRQGDVRPLTRSNGLPLGLFVETAIDVQSVRLEPLDTLLLFTDGVTEATDASGEFFGAERIPALVREHENASAQQICDSLVATLVAFRGAAPQADDITLLAVRVS
jgi:sigma-B regulation protein RsbU (phosphoserine phosphatase)